MSSVYDFPPPGAAEYGLRSRSMGTDVDMGSSSKSNGLTSGFPEYGLRSRSSLGPDGGAVLGGGGGKVGALRSGPTPSEDKAAAHLCCACRFSTVGNILRGSSFGKRSFRSSALLMGMSKIAFTSRSYSVSG